MLFEHKHN